MICEVCPHRCNIGLGQLGRCRARGWRDDAIEPLSYGRITSLALDPVEKKPLARWKPGTWVVSVGSYGCNLRCPFCQNHSIAQVGEDDVAWREIAPQELVALTVEARERNPLVSGIAYTYNEPLVAWEYVRDTGLLAHEAGLANVLVSNGCARLHARVLPLVRGRLGHRARMHRAPRRRTRLSPRGDLPGSSRAQRLAQRDARTCELARIRGSRHHAACNALLPALEDGGRTPDAGGDGVRACRCCARGPAPRRGG